MVRLVSLLLSIGLFVCPEFLPAQTLLLFGGKNHETFLGCLNCSKYDSGSIWNKYGTFGSKYNSYSPWNKYSNDPPIIVDKDGNNYGYFTANKYFHNRTKDKSLVYILDNYEEVIERLDKIRDDMK